MGFSSFILSRVHCQSWLHVQFASNRAAVVWRFGLTTLYVAYLGTHWSFVTNSYFYSCAAVTTLLHFTNWHVDRLAFLSVWAWRARIVVVLLVLRTLCLHFTVHHAPSHHFSTGHWNFLELASGLDTPVCVPWPDKSVTNRQQCLLLNIQILKFLPRTKLLILLLLGRL